VNVTLDRCDVRQGARALLSGAPMLHRSRFEKSRRHHGAALVEFALVAPLVLTAMLSAYDMGRLVRISQLSTDVSRAAASVGAHGLGLAQALQVARTTRSALGIDDVGIIFVTLVAHEDANDRTPWVESQVSGGDLPGFTSRLGTPGGPTTIHDIEALEPGNRLTAVEVAVPFKPVLPIGRVYPSMVYDVAYFLERGQVSGT